MYNQLNYKTDSELVHQYAPLVKRIAHHLMARLPSHLVVDDLIQAGMVGLLEAFSKYDPSKGASFETYAGIRIRGAIIDEVRRGDWTPRSVHRNSRRVSEAIAQVEARTGRDANDIDVAQELGISLDDYYALLQDSVESKLFSLEEISEAREDGLGEQPTSKTPEPIGQLEVEGFQTALARAIDTLPDREKLVLSLYYTEELNLKEIGQILEVTESRVSQIHSQAASRLRVRLKDWNI